MHFAQPSLLEHGVRSGMDALVEFFARGHQSGFQNAPSFEGDAAGTVHLGYRLAREDTYFDGANEFLFVGRCDSPGGFRIKAF